MGGHASTKIRGKPRKETQDPGNQGSTVRETQGAGTHGEKCKGGVLKVTGLELPPKSTLHICWEGEGWEEKV